MRISTGQIICELCRTLNVNDRFFAIVVGTFLGAKVVEVSSAEQDADGKFWGWSAWVEPRVVDNVASLSCRSFLSGEHVAERHLARFQRTGNLSPWDCQISSPNWLER